MLDLCLRVSSDMPIDLRFCWFNTGVEYRATKQHLDYLEQRYGIEILRYKPKKSIPTCCERYGQPFLSKFVSENIERLQRHGFQWEDEPFDVLIERYPKCKTSLKWWTNGWTRDDKPGYYDIGRFAWLKEFMVENPPWFRISNRCCSHTKKYVARHIFKDSYEYTRMYRDFQRSHKTGQMTLDLRHAR